MLRRIAVGSATAALTLAAGLALPVLAVASPASAPINGVGSTWAFNAMTGWQSEQYRDGRQVNYSPAGSSRGRTDFASGATDFAVTDLTYVDAGEPEPPRSYRYLPLTAGAVTFPYQVKVDGVARRDIRLSGATLADIFRGRITNWNDATITADNNGHPVAPDLPITPVVRADASATTYRLTDWFSTAFPGRWSPYTAAGATALFPAPAGRTVAVSGSDGIVNRIRQTYGNGTIGYVETSYAANVGLPVAAVANASRRFLLPDPGNVSLSLRHARFAAAGVTDLHPLYDDPDPRVYPLAYFSYGIVPTASDDPDMTTAKRQTAVDFFSYAVCAGQQTAAQRGYAPLPINLTRTGLTALAQVGLSDPEVDPTATALALCGNPTLVHRADGTVVDALNRTVPQPADCTRRNAGPCTG